MMTMKSGTALGGVDIITDETGGGDMKPRNANKTTRNTNALAVVAGALIALIAVLAFLAVISHRGGAQEPAHPLRPGVHPVATRMTTAPAAVATAGRQLTVSVCAVAS